MVWCKINSVILFGFFFKILFLSIQGSALQIYLETTHVTTWYNSFNSCLARGMELAILNSNADYNEAKDLIASKNITLECIWIGYKMKILTLHAYGWVNGEDSLFEHWGTSNPDYFYQESCVRLASKYQYAFADHPCTFSCFFMCTGGSKPVIHDVYSTPVIKIGQPTEVMCKYTSLWNSTVEWIKVTSTGEKVIQFDEEQILYNMSSSTVNYVTENILSFAITLNDIDLLSFKCRVENQFGIDDGPLNVIERKIGPPIIHQTVTMFAVTVRENVTFVCNATSSCPNVTGIVWRREVNGTTTTLTTDPLSQYLTLTQVGLNDSGIYSCSVTNTEGTSVLYFSLQVTGGGPPVIQHTGTTFVVTIKENVTFTCNATSSCPNVTGIVWRREVNGTTTTLTTDPLSQYLTLTQVGLNDSGIYSCSVTNTEGTSVLYFSLQVTGGPPVIQHTGTTFVVTIKENVTFTCNATSSCPNVTGIVWRREVNGTTTTLTTDPLSQYLTLTQVGLNDSGIYSCSVTNTEGTSVLYFSLQVLGEQSMCPCECDDMMRLNSFTMENHTFEEWKDILAPITQQLRKELHVDKSSLSSTIYRLRCMKDDRTSAARLGYIGIIFLVMVPLAILFADFTSCCSKC